MVAFNDGDFKIWDSGLEFPTLDVLLNPKGLDTDVLITSYELDGHCNLGLVPGCKKSPIRLTHAVVVEGSSEPRLPKLFGVLAQFFLADPRKWRGRRLEEVYDLHPRRSADIIYFDGVELF